MRKQMNEQGWLSGDYSAITATAGGAALLLSVGYVGWLLKTGSLAAALLTFLPLFRDFDPLLILIKKQNADKRKDEEDHETEPSSLDLLFEQKQA